MLARQQPFAILTAFLVLCVIIYLIRRKKLREEYALLWLAVGVGVLALAAWYPALVWITRVIGAVQPTTTLFLFALLFLMVISIHFSISHSKLADQIKDLTQEIALLRKEVEKNGGKGRKGREEVNHEDTKAQR